MKAEYTALAVGFTLVLSVSLTWISTTNYYNNSVTNIYNNNSLLNDPKVIQILTQMIGNGSSLLSTSLSETIKDQQTTINRLNANITILKHRLALATVTVTGKVQTAGGTTPRYVVFVNGNNLYYAALVESAYSVMLANNQQYRVRIHYDYGTSYVNVNPGDCDSADNPVIHSSILNLNSSTPNLTVPDLTCK